MPKMYRTHEKEVNHETTPPYLIDQFMTCIENDLPQEVCIRRRMNIAFTAVVESNDEVVLFLSIQHYVLQEVCIRRRMGSRIQLLVSHVSCFRGAKW